MDLIFNLYFYVGVIIGGLLAVVYFSLTGSKLNWTFKK